ncbi:MAG: flagella basal body P-ring formation protein FlgA, partial [Marinobacter sp.]|nr:flagella basal body P-ring formation protein FlgA [Marinobacter sp.]
MRITIFVTALLMSTMTGTAMAADTTADQITTAADKFLGAFANEQEGEGFAVEYDSGSLDPRLSLATCDS